MTKAKGRVCSVILAALLLTSCATTTVTRVWKDETYRGGEIKRILVIGIVRDRTIRNMFEDEFTTQLRNREIEAIPSHTVLKSEQVADQEAITAKSRELGVDVVLITRPIDQEIVRTLVPTGSTFVPCDYYGTMQTYYAAACGYYQPTSYVVQDEFAYLETNLYDGRSEKLIWSAYSEMWLVEPEPKLIRSFVLVMMKKLVETKLIQ